MTARDLQLAVTFEYTTRDMPQQNFKAEVIFTYIANRGRVTMIAANIPKEM